LVIQLCFCLQPFEDNVNAELFQNPVIQCQVFNALKFFHSIGYKRLAKSLGVRSEPEIVISYQLNKDLSL